MKLSVDSPWIQTCATYGDDVSCVSRSSHGMYSPCDSLNMFLRRSTMARLLSLGSNSAMSPVWKKPSASSASAVASGFL